MSKNLEDSLKHVMLSMVDSFDREHVEAFPNLDISKYFQNNIRNFDLDGFHYRIIEGSGAKRQRIEIELKKYVNEDQNLIIMESDTLQTHLSAFFRKSGSDCTADEARRVIRRALSYSNTKKKTDKGSTVFSDAFWFHYLRNLILFYHYGSIQHSPFATDGKNPWNIMPSFQEQKNALVEQTRIEALKSEVFRKAFAKEFPKHNIEMIRASDLCGWVKHLNPEIVKLARRRLLKDL